LFGLFKSAPFVDPQLGELRRWRGAWRGTIALGGAAPVPLVLSGGRSAPDGGALQVARSIPSQYAAWCSLIEPALFEHYEPYAEAVAAGEIDDAPAGPPRIDAPAAVWPHTTPEFVQVAPLDGELTTEIGYRVAWDEEHTLGARLRDGRLVELCGSVRAP
jgi:hypothetical protein